MPQSDRPRSPGEYVALMAFMMSVVALAIDAMLPALYEISRELGAPGENDRQLVITVLFLGMAIGNIVYGPVSDSFGRKRPVYVGYLLFIAGSVLSAVATTFEIMLLGRFLQGLGAAGPRILTVAIIRDEFEGRNMARIMSLVMMVFIMVPALAPAVGQALILLSGWRAIFWFFVAMALITLAWFWLRQPETLAPQNRVAFSGHGLYRAVLLVVTQPIAIGYTLAAGLIFGAFVGYLNSSQQVFQELFGLGVWFPLYFGVLALVIGVASYINSRLVLRFGMQRLCLWALTWVSVLSTLFLVLCLFQAPSLAWFMGFLVVSFFAMGILFGNFNTLAMEPLGKIAGTGSAVVGFVSTLVAMALGHLIGDQYDGTVLPMVSGFCALSIASLALVLFLSRYRHAGPIG